MAPRPGESWPPACTLSSSGIPTGANISTRRSLILTCPAIPLALHRPNTVFLLAGFAGGNVRGSGGRHSFRLRSADGIGPVLKLACHGVLPKFAQGLSVTIQLVR